MVAEKGSYSGQLILRQVRILSYLVHNEHQFHGSEDAQALRTGLYLYAMTRRFKSIEELDAQTMRAFLHWMHAKSALTQTCVATELRRSQSYVSKILGMRSLECQLTAESYEQWVSVYAPHFCVRAGFSFKNMAVLLQPVER